MVRSSQVAATAIVTALAMLPAGLVTTRARAAEPLPRNLVAVVSEVPVGLGRITVAELRHALAQVAAQRGRRSVPKPGEGGYGKLSDEALDGRLESVWVQGQAIEWGIAVTPRQVSRSVAQIKRESFKDAAAYRGFLKESHFTRRDVRDRVEIQLLSLRLQERLEKKISREARNPAEEQRALNEFVKEFSERWRSRTVCAPAFATDRCSNGPAPA